MKVALACIGRLENRYAVEFVEYYKQLGFDHIYIADNNHDEEEYFEDVLQPYIDDQFVTILNYRNRTGDQLNYYKKIYYDISKDYNWIFFCDFDEFLTLTKDKNIKDYLSRNCFKPYNQILINWKVYNDNDLVYYDNKPCLERFTTPIKNDKCLQYYDIPENAHVKSILRTNIIDVKILNPHNFFNDTLNNTTCNNIGTHIYPDIYFDTIISVLPFQVVNHDLAYIKHFTTKTIEEWINKYKRGMPDQSMDSFFNSYPLERFFRINNITEEKLKFLQEHGFNIENINEENCKNWYR